MARYIMTHSKEHLWNMIEKGQAQLHPLPHAVLVTTMTIHPTGIKEGTVWLGGGDLQEIKKLLPMTEVWLKQEGCTFVTIRGRRGWARVFRDYREDGIILLKELP
jgi:hypothetical protein